MSVPELRAALSPVLFPGAETATLATVLACVAIGALLLQRGRLRLTPDIWPAAAAMSVAAVCVPSVLLGLWGYDFRLPLLAAILLVGARVD